MSSWPLSLLEKAIILPSGEALIPKSEPVPPFQLLTRLEGIIPALETAHAFAALDQMSFSPDDRVVVCLSGRGDKDLSTYMKFMQ